MRTHAPCLVTHAGVILLLIAITATATHGQATDEAGTDDSNPTRPVLFSVRPEFYNPGGDVSRSALIFRYDRAAFRQRRWLPGRRGVVMRFEGSLARTHLAGRSGETGLGDLYGQLLLIPYFTRSFAFVAGTGLVIPTATGDLLGAGKWVLAPATGPVWFTPGPGMFFVKFQNFVSVSGDSDRADINFLLITPMFVHVFEGRWWLLADTETRTDWTRDERTSVKSGLQIGKAVAPRLALWVKPEVWWGANRDGGWNLRIAMVWYR